MLPVMSSSLHQKNTQKHKSHTHTHTHTELITGLVIMHIIIYMLCLRLFTRRIQLAYDPFQNTNNKTRCSISLARVRLVVRIILFQYFWGALQDRHYRLQFPFKFPLTREGNSRSPTSRCKSARTLRGCGRHGCYC